MKTFRHTAKTRIMKFLIVSIFAIVMTYGFATPWSQGDSWQWIRVIILIPFIYMLYLNIKPSLVIKEGRLSYDQPFKRSFEISKAVKVTLVQRGRGNVYLWFILDDNSKKRVPFNLWEQENIDNFFDSLREINPDLIIENSKLK